MEASDDAVVVLEKELPLSESVVRVSLPPDRATVATLTTVEPEAIRSEVEEKEELRDTAAPPPHIKLRPHLISPQFISSKPSARQSTTPLQR